MRSGSPEPGRGAPCSTREALDGERAGTGGGAQDAAVSVLQTEDLLVRILSHIADTPAVGAAMLVCQLWNRVMEQALKASHRRKLVQQFGSITPTAETLITLAARRAVIHGTFILHGPPILGTDHDEGSIIQRARRVHSPGADRQGTRLPEFQLKFYSSRNLADHEREVYAELANLRAAVCPAVTGIFHASKLEAKDSAHGEAWSIPTFVAFEKTDDLNAWSHLFSCSPLSVARAISELAGLLEALHERGIVHRNVRPENLRWHSRKLSWSLVNFGISGDVGYPADVKWVGHYTAPEVAVAIEAGTTTMIISSSLDMWSLGVVAYEILTRAPAFSEGLTDKEVQAMLTGKGSLPWENNGAGRNRLKRFAARLKGVVLGGLARDPNKRVTAKAMKGSLKSLMEYGS